MEGGIKVDEEFELANMVDSQRGGGELGQGVVKAPGLILNLKGEVDEEVVNGSGGCEGVGAVLVLVGGDIAHAQGVDGDSWEIDPPEDNDLTVGRQFSKTSDDPRVSILDNTANLALNVHCGFSGIVAVKSGPHGHGRSAVLFDGGYGCGVVGELDHDTASFGHHVFGSEPDQHLYVFLADVEFVLGAYNFKGEGGDGSSELEPAVVSGEGVGDGFRPPARSEGVGFEGGIDSGDGDGPFGNEGLETDDGAVANFDGQPVDGGIDDAVLIVGLVAAVDIAGEGEVGVHVDDPPIMLGEGPPGVRGYVEVLVGLTHRGSRLEEDRVGVKFISIGDAFGQHVEEHVVFCVIKLTLNVGGDGYCIDFEDEINVNLFYAGIFDFGEEDTHFLVGSDCVEVDDLNPYLVVVGV